MILLDTNALVALIEPRDALGPRAAADFQRVRTRALLLPTAILAESLHFLPHVNQRARLRALLDRSAIEMYAVAEDRALLDETFDWLEKYAEHSPDFADALLAVLCGREARLSVWSYDVEFTSVWRRPDGSRIPMAFRR
jgi:predicted nucleic acid-binding protein